MEQETKYKISEVGDIGMWGQAVSKFPIGTIEIMRWVRPEEGIERWEPLIRRPKERDGKYYKSFNERIIERARESRTELILGDYSFNAPPKKELARMRKEGQATSIQGYDNKPFYLYEFAL